MIFGPVSLAAWIFYFVLVAGLGFLTQHAIKGWPPRKRTFSWMYAGLCVLVPLMLFLFARPRAELKPHFTISLQIGDSPAAKVFLTNDFLFARRIEKAGSLPNGAFRSNRFVSGCVVIPVQPGQSNAIFNFIADNDSAVKATDFEASVGFPKDWKCDTDPVQWHPIDEFLIIPGAIQFEATNMQYFAARSPRVVLPFDTLKFPPITNRCTPEYIGATFKAGLLEFGMRSTGYEDVLAAHIVFSPVTSNSFKPFVARLLQGTNGVFNISITPKEFADSQK